MAKFLPEVMTNDFPIQTGPIFENDKKTIIMFCERAMCLDTEQIINLRRDGITLGSMLRAAG